MPNRRKLKSDNNMKKLLVMICVAIFTIGIGSDAAAQSRTNVPKGLTFCSVPFGISVEDFKARATTGSLQDSLANLVGAKKCIIYVPNVSLPKKPNIACSVEVSFGDDYGAWVIYGFDMLRNILVAKYGSQYHESKDNDGRQKLIWSLPYGEVSLKRGKENAVISYYDYAAMKKAFPSLFKML